MVIKFKYFADFSNSHLDYFPENLGVINEEQGERLNQDIKVMGYNNQSDGKKIYECRKRLFTKKGRQLQVNPPTVDALYLHITQASYRGGCIWSNAANPWPQLRHYAAVGRVFSEISCFPRPCIPVQLLHIHLTSPSSAINHNVMSRPNLSNLHISAWHGEVVVMGVAQYSEGIPYHAMSLFGQAFGTLVRGVGKEHKEAMSRSSAEAADCRMEKSGKRVGAEREEAYAEREGWRGREREREITRRDRLATDDSQASPCPNEGKRAVHQLKANCTPSDRLEIPGQAKSQKLAGRDVRTRDPKTTLTEPQHA
ncbi:hypothetical protein PR048_016336 [Dryococelus australis]|uniref:Uncharacterized protein n=1 Tax=Dryococelus australis TaxID=614101 RepID=A0ABQ9HJF7_9NEOP|nr:hypothetical protein PR048_016336 [Dryococelus australis]